MTRLASLAGCVLLVVAGLFVGGPRATAQAPAAPQATPPPPADTAALRAQYEQWRKDFKTWGKWAPEGQESKGTSALITAQKVQAALKLVTPCSALPRVSQAPVQAALR